MGVMNAGIQIRRECGTSGDKMSKICRITLSANAGVAVSMCGTCLWIDALHDTKLPEYSTLDKDRLDAMRASGLFLRPDALIYTHCHEDHFSEELTEAVLEEYPGAVAILPERRLKKQILLRDSFESFTVGELLIRMIRVPHEGAENISVSNYAILISPAQSGDGSFSILVLGDAELGSSVLVDGLAGLGSPGTDLVIADFPWAAVKRGRTILEDVIMPEHLVIYHLPFEEDDTRGYRSMIRRAAGRIRNIPDVRIMDGFLQTEIFKY